MICLSFQTNQSGKKLEMSHSIFTEQVWMVMAGNFTDRVRRVQEPSGASSEQLWQGAARSWSLGKCQPHEF